jgi:hypothetical protein
MKLPWEKIAKFLVAAGLGIALFVVFCMLLWQFFGSQVQDPSFGTESRMILSIIIGSATLLTTFALVAVIFSAINLQNRRQALGLPEGSVRAIIAFSLIIIFVIMSVYLFNMVGPRTQEVTDAKIWNKTLGEFQEIEGTALIPLEPTEDQKSIANSLITTVGTLVVALAGFYFGTRAVEVAKGVEVAKPTLSITTPDKSPYTMDPTENKTLEITLQPTPEDESITWESPEGDPKGSLVQFEPKKFRYTRGKDPKATVTLKFRLSRYPDVKAELKVTKPALSIVNPDKDTCAMDPTKDAFLEITVKPTPENETVICEETPEGDQDGSLEESATNKFKYTRGSKPGDSVILTFKLKNYPEIKKQLKITKKT